MLGASGCGKSNIVRIVAGLEQETKGNILIDNKGMKNIELGAKNIDIMFQNYPPYPTMTVRENI